jgi:histone-lysine N-methyltransferase SETD3
MSATVVDSYTELNDTLVQEEKNRTDTLVKWLLDNGCSFPMLYFEYLAVDFRGVATNADIANNEIILKVSPACLLTIEKAKESAIGRRIISAGCRLRSTHSYVAAFILEERKKGTDSFWFPYIDILPKSYRHMPVFLDETELKYLTGSLVLSEVEDRRESYRVEYQNLCQFVPEFAEHSMEDFFWARLVVLTRIFGITIHGSKTSSMVPMADMLNHKRPPETYWTFDDSHNAFTITTTKEFKAGEQVYDSYGRKCNTEFFLNYGFVADNNQYNTCKIVLALMDNDILFSRKYELLRRGGRDVKEIEVGTDYQKDTVMEAFSFCRLMVATEAEMVHITGGDPYRRPNMTQIRPLNIRNELEALKKLAAAAAEALALFDTTLEDDMKLLNDPSLSMNIKNCIKCRICEKEIMTYYTQLPQVLLPIFAAEQTPQSAYEACTASAAIREAPHLRHYVHSALLPLVESGEGSIGDLVSSFERMTVEGATAKYSRISSYSDSDDDY